MEGHEKQQKNKKNIVLSPHWNRPPARAYEQDQSYKHAFHWNGCAQKTKINKSTDNIYAQTQTYQQILCLANVVSIQEIAGEELLKILDSQLKFHRAYKPMLVSI
jgi:hypothetical protein